ncbi:MAG: hypothetical protein IJB64_03200 [Akkermansia sp.]|nr:hypothetical protein [Akkermansia sp.]
MKILRPFCSLLFVPLSLANTEHEPLVYDDSTIVSAELRCPSPNGQAELVYRGTRHVQKAEIGVAHEMVIILKNGKEIPLGEHFCSMPLYRANIIHQPWSPDGKWLVFPTGRFSYCFYPVAELNDNSFNGENAKILSVTEQYTHTIAGARTTRFVLDGGQWQADGTFTFRAGLSGYLAPYSATVSNAGVTYKCVGDMVKTHP